MIPSPYVSDVTSNDFEQQVLARSRDIPVLVDFWAPWCAPCRALAPLLEQLADRYAGKLHVAKVNTDEEQELALRFQIRGIPAVKLFRNGKLVGEFVGVQPESAIKELVEPHLPNEVDALIERSDVVARAGKTDDAADMLRSALQQNPADDRLKIALTKLLLSQPPSVDDSAVLAESRGLLDSLSLRAGIEPEIERLRARLNLLDAVAGAPGREALEQTVRAHPDDYAARFRLGARFALAGETESALDQFLEVVRRNRSFGDDAARKAMVGVFNSLGNQHPLTLKYRGLLSRELN